MKTWEQAAEAALNKVLGPQDDGDFFRWPFEALYEKGAWNALAKRSALALEAAGEFDSEEFLALLASKHHDYGPMNIMKFGRVGINVRLWDKLARLKNIEARGARPKNEGRIDTLKDIVGYVVISEMLERETDDRVAWFMLPLADDLKDAA